MTEKEKFERFTGINFPDADLSKQSNGEYESCITDAYFKAWKATITDMENKWIAIAERLPSAGIEVDLFSVKMKKRLSGFFYLSSLNVFRSKSTKEQYPVGKFSHWIEAPLSPF